MTAVDERLSFMSNIYIIYREYKTKMDELKSKIWKELNVKELRELSDVLPKQVRKLRGKNYEVEAQYINLNNIIEDLKKSSDVIERLKFEGVKEMHFKEISEEVKVHINTDMKTMLVSDVFKLKLSSNIDFITEIAEKAKSQENLEKEIQIIESKWKEFAMVIVKKEREGKSV